MRDLRLVGFEDGIVIFESLEGEKYRVLADDALRLALRQAAQAKPSDLTITPREIQDRIRSGQSIEQIASETGAAPDFVEKFAQPVLDELEHIVNSALAIRITIAGDRFNDDIQEEFGNLITSRLLASGASDIRWSSKRGEGGIWNLSAEYNISGHAALAVWSYEPRKFHLSPENDSAVALSNHNSTMDGPIAKLRTVSAVVDASSTVPTAQGSAGSAENTASVRPNSAEVNESAPAAFRKLEEGVKPQIETQLSAEAATSDLLDELRKRRETTNAPVELAEESLETVETLGGSFDDDFEEFDTAPQTGSLSVVPDFEDALTDDDAPSDDFPVNGLEAEPDDDIEPTDAPDQDVDLSDRAEVGAASETVHESPVAPPATQAKKGRAAMPSWDEIVFGTKTDDEL